MKIIVASAFVLAGCVQLDRAVMVLDESVYPQVRVVSCALSEELRNERQVRRYERSGVYVDADCEWKAGDTLEDYFSRSIGE
jgi:hypothetical protein